MPSPEAVTNDGGIFDAEFLARLRLLFVRLRRRRRQARQGVQESPAAGHSREFRDHRHYARGDDIRTVDWRLYGRLDRLFVRVFESVQEFHVHVVVDTSASMADPHPVKRIAALRLAAALAYLGLSQQHRVALIGVDRACRRELPPLKGPGHIHAIIRRLVDLPFAGIGDLDAALAAFRPDGGRRGVVFLISDLLGGDPARTRELARRFASWPGETHVLHVLDPAEERAPAEGELLLVDSETGAERRVWLDRDAAQRYAAQVVAWRDGIAKECLGRRIDYLRWDAAAPFDDQFVTLLERGSGLAGT